MTNVSQCYDAKYTSAEYSPKIVLAHVTIEGKAVCGGVSSDARNKGNYCNTCLQ
jgi:hypothetical protein